MEHFETEEQQVEALKKWWKENGMSVVTGVVVGLSLLMGWRWWQGYSEQQAYQASGLYEQVQLFLTNEDSDKAQNFAEKLLSEHSGSTYAVLAVLNLARLDLEKGQIDSSHARLQWILDQNSTLPELTHIARLRKARLYLSEDKLDKAKALIEGIEVGKFKGAYAELRGDIALPEGQLDAARTAYNEALEDDQLSMKHREWVQMKLDDLGMEQVGRIQGNMPLSVAGNPSTVQ
jgi:predicted negative regulator of RcsB-dependent stress response